MPSNYLHGMSLVVVVSLEFLVVELILYAELLVVAGLHIETLETLLDSSWNEVFEESLLGFLSPFFGNNSDHRIIVLVWMTGCMQETAWIRPYVLLVEEMQIQPLF